MNVAESKMELQIPSFPILFSFLVLIFTIIKIRKKNQNSKLPPGPWKFPLLGNIPQLRGALLHQRFRDLAKIHGPIMSIRMGQVPAVVISSVELAREVLKNQAEAFAGRPYTLAGEILYYDRKDIVFAPYGDHWRQMRKICTLEFLSAKRVLSFRSVREENVSEFIQSVLRPKAESPVNLTKNIGDLTNSVMLVTTLGKKGRNKKNLTTTLEIVKDAVLAASGGDLFPSLKFLPYLTGAKPRMQRVQKQIDKILDDILAEHKAQNSSEDKNLLQVLLDLQDNGDLLLPLTDEVIKANLMELFLGGSHTSSKTVEWAMAELMKSPESMRKAQEEVRRVFGETAKVEESRIQELKYLNSVIKETLRLHPPSTFITRECRERTKVDGYDIFPKTTVHVNVWAIGRNSDVWPAAEKFYPERFAGREVDFKGANVELIPFGAGKRICPGISLAITYVDLLLANLLYHFDWKFPDGITHENLDMTEIYHGALGRKEDLYLIPIPFSPLSKN